MAKTKLKVQSKFFGGITRDDKSKVVGACSNIEEIDIFSNADYIQAEQIMSLDAMPEDTTIYNYTSGGGTVYGLGKKTSDGKVRIVSSANGGSSNPGDFATLYTSSSASNLFYQHSPFQFFNDGANYLYYITNDSGTLELVKSLVATPAETVVGTLAGLTANTTRTFMKVLYGELYIGNGRYIAKIDEDGVFTDKVFTLPNDMEAVDIVAVGDKAIILARPVDSTLNFSKGYWWDLTTTSQFEDSFTVPMGGPQWIVNHKETIKLLCAQNGIAKIFQLSGAFQGAVPIEIPGISLTNIGAETSTKFISTPYMVATKDKILYFALFKTDKSGIYALGQLDNDKPNALVLAKRFHTTDYSAHNPNGLYIMGPNFYCSFLDGSTQRNSRCMSAGTPARSSNAILETIWIDDDSATSDKDLKEVFITSYPLTASTDVDVYVASDYGSYTQYYRPDGTSFNTTNGVLGAFKVTLAKKKVYKVKLALTSSTVYSPKVTSIGLLMDVQDGPSHK